MAEPRKLSARWSVKVKVTEADISQAYSYHQQRGVWWLCSQNNPVALALQRVLKGHAVGYRTVHKVTMAKTADGLSYPVGTPVATLPDDAIKFLRKFGYSLRRKESKESLAARKELRGTSSDHKEPVVPIKRSDRVSGPLEFELSFPS